MTASTDLKTVLDNTAAAIAGDPRRAKATFAANGELVGVTEVDIRSGDHVVQIDEPEALGGTNLAPNTLGHMRWGLAAFR